MTAPREDPGYARLLLMVGEIAGDVKNLLTRATEQNDRVNRMEDRQNGVNGHYEDRLQRLEKMRGKLLGLAWATPVVISVAGIVIGRMLYYG